MQDLRAAACSWHGASRSPGATPRVGAAALATAVAEETFEFTAETDRVMEIIINSLYSDKDVFLANW